MATEPTNPPEQAACGPTTEPQEPDAAARGPLAHVAEVVVETLVGAVVGASIGTLGARLGRRWERSSEELSRAPRGSNTGRTSSSTWARRASCRPASPPGGRDARPARPESLPRSRARTFLPIVCAARGGDRALLGVCGAARSTTWRRWVARVSRLRTAPRASRSSRARSRGRLPRLRVVRRSLRGDRARVQVPRALLTARLDHPWTSCASLRALAPLGAG
jgi:hypothetical protein